MIALPTIAGWSVSWYNGKIWHKTIKMKDGSKKVIREIRLCDSYNSTSKEAVLKKKAELEEAGFEIQHFGECIF